MMNEPHLSCLMELVEKWVFRSFSLCIINLLCKDTFQLVVGFCSTTLLHHISANPLNKLVMKLFTDCSSFHSTLTGSIVSDFNLLHHTSVAYITKEAGKVSTMVIGLHFPSSNAWGIMWKYCRQAQCVWPMDVHLVNAENGKIKQSCLWCHWEFPAILAMSLKWLEQWSSKHPLVYIWLHPITSKQLMPFVNPVDTMNSRSIGNIEMD